MSEWQWVQRLDEKMEKDEFLQENQAGAKVGQGVGGVAGFGVAAVGIVSAGVAMAPAAAAAETVGAATLAAGGASAFAYRTGYFVGNTAAKVAVKNTAVAAFKLGRFGGAYAGASVQSGARWIGDKIRKP